MHIHIYMYMYIHHIMSHITRVNNLYQTPRHTFSRDNVNKSYHTPTRDTGWRRLIGCLKLQVFFCKRATNHRALWREMTYEDKASYNSTPPCMTHISESYHTCKYAYPALTRDMTYSHVWHDSFLRVIYMSIGGEQKRSLHHLWSSCVSWLISMRDTTHSHVRHDSYACVTWLTLKWDMNGSRRYTQRESIHHCGFSCVSWLIPICGATHFHMRHDKYTCVTWLIHMCDMTHTHVWHDSYTRVTWLIHMCDMTHSYERCE